MAAVLSAGALFSLFAQDDAAPPKYVEVKKPFFNIYVTNTDPKSEIIRQTRKGEYLELVSEGQSWYKVRVDGKTGFLESKAGRVVNNKDANVIMILLYIILLGGCAGGAVYYIKKQQKVLSR
jgi:SH3-like domain-containing protein